MTGKTEFSARIQSKNSLNLAFPYAGANYGYLIVRQHPGYGLDVIVQVNKGQILCHAYQNCTVKVRFGDSQPVTFSAAPSADLDATAVFLRNPKSFIEKASKAKGIKVQATMYQAGDVVMEFESKETLAWRTGAKK